MTSDEHGKHFKAIFETLRQHVTDECKKNTPIDEKFKKELKNKYQTYKDQNNK